MLASPLNALRFYSHIHWPEARLADKEDAFAG
jgi:hypothetical protein